MSEPVAARRERFGDRARHPRPSTLRAAVRHFSGFGVSRFLLAQVVGCALARFFLGPPTLTEGLAVVAIAVYWPLQEWFFHWTLLHMKPRRVLGWVLDTPMAKTHRMHHRNPWRVETALLPWAAVLLIEPFLLLFFWLVMPSLAGAVTAVGVFTFATLVYEWVHYLTHTDYRPRGRYMRAVRRNHRLHHFRNENYWHSFTVPVLDSLLGTGPPPASVPRSETCHDLGVRQGDEG